MPKFTDDLISIADYGIDANIDADETVEVSLRDLARIEASLGELVRYFHNPEHFKSLGDLNSFLGSADDRGGFALMHRAYYEICQRMTPDKLQAMHDDGTLDPKDLLPMYMKE